MSTEPSSRTTPAPTRESTHRGTIFLEDQAEVLRHTAYDAHQFIIRVQAPKCAAAATAGTFVHLRCDDSLPMRRPLSIMRTNAAEGWVEILYKLHGAGLERLAERKAGDRLSVLGPIGVGFAPHQNRPRVLLIGGGVGIPPMIFLAETLASATTLQWQPLALFGSEIPFPFKARPSTMLVPGMPAGVIAAMPLLEEWGIASRLASRAGYAGCFDGFVTELAAGYLRTLTAAALGEVEIFACGPTPMLLAVAHVARDFGVPAQVCLEEFMACAVGGCAGCAVQVRTPSGNAMKRVCVDGPVFEAAAVFPD
jgi:dihydroorotate dehydrogenase electron transfer subunit